MDKKTLEAVELARKKGGCLFKSLDPAWPRWGLAQRGEQTIWFKTLEEAIAALK